MKSNSKLFFTYIILILLSIIMLFPFLIALTTALKTTSEIANFTNRILPSQPQWNNFLEVWKSGNYARYFFNTAFVSFIATFLTLAISSMAGYAFAKLEFKGRKILLSLFVGTMIVPMQVTMIPVFLIMSKIGTVDSLWSVVFPLSASAFGIFLMNQFITSVPNEIIEASRIDGCNEYSIYFRMILPLIKAPLVSLGILSFLGAWNDFIWALIMLNTPEKHTLQIALTYFRGEFSTPWNLLMAATIIAIIPVIVVFVIFQRAFVEGIGTTGIKS